MTYIYGLAMIIPTISVRNASMPGLHFLHGLGRWKSRQI